MKPLDGNACDLLLGGQPCTLPAIIPKKLSSENYWSLAQLLTLLQAMARHLSVSPATGRTVTKTPKKNRLSIVQASPLSRSTRENAAVLVETKTTDGPTIISSSSPLSPPKHMLWGAETVQEHYQLIEESLEICKNKTGNAGLADPWKNRCFDGTEDVLVSS